MIQPGPVARGHCRDDAVDGARGIGHHREIGHLAQCRVPPDPPPAAKLRGVGVDKVMRGGIHQAAVAEEIGGMSGHGRVLIQVKAFCPVLQAR